MALNKKTAVQIPSIEQVEAERARLRYKRRYSKTLKSTVAILVVVAALAVLVATLWMPVLQIYGSSMSPTLKDGEIVIALKGSQFSTGDVVGLWYENKLLVKRVIGKPGDWINIDKDGNITVNGELLDEPYIDEKAYGETTVELPYQVGDDAWFVVGDNRDVSIDSRNTAVGCIPTDQIVGRIVFCIWPLKDFGVLK